MKKALQYMIREEGASVNASTIAGLISRGLIDSTKTLTHAGWKQAVVALPLQEQCIHMGITYEEVHGLVYHNQPELAAWKYFSSLGYSGGYCEGGPILLLIRAAALNVLATLNTFGSRQDACTRFTEAQLFIHKGQIDAILNEIHNANASRIISNFDEIYSPPIMQEWYPGLTAATIALLFESLGSERLAQITSAMLEDPYLYRAGWPDLTMTNGIEMLWAEIKTTDRLHMSQITTIHRMKPLLPGRICVVQLIS
jgi:hypothetical protein